MNTTLLRYDGKDVFEMLLMVCKLKNYVVTQKDFENKIIKAKKNSLFFWKNLNLELRLFIIENEVIKVSVKILRKNIVQKELEEQFIDAMNKSF